MIMLEIFGKEIIEINIHDNPRQLALGNGRHILGVEHVGVLVGERIDETVQFKSQHIIRVPAGGLFIS